MERLKRIFSISRKIKRLAQRKYSPTRLQQEEHDRKLIALAKNMRADRLGKVGALHRFILEIAAEFYGVDVEELVAGIIDSDTFVDNLDSVFTNLGNYVVLVCYAPKLGFPITSGRYDHKLRYVEVLRSVAQIPPEVRLKDWWMVAFRTTNKPAIDGRSMNDKVAIFSFGSEGKEIALFAVKEHLMKVVIPALEAVDGFGLCREPQKRRFFHQVNMFYKFIASSNEGVQNRVIFDVSNMLYKGFLLAKYQIEATAKNREKVYEVQWYFNLWMKKIGIILKEGKQIQRDPPSVGPLQLLEHWRRNLTRYQSVTEFVASTPFQNHYACLVLSRSSKLLKRWKLMDDEVTNALNEALDNVRYISSLQTFWNPLYMGDPPDVLFAIETLLAATRSVSKSANFFNTCETVTGLFIKITNQLTIALCNYLTNNQKKSIWDISSEKLIENIGTCKHVMDAYRNNFYRTVQDMKDSKENPWIVSPVYIFCNLETFTKRLDKITDIAKSEITYSILDKIKISGMEKFADAIKAARIKIYSKPYDPLNFRIETFESDYVAFMKAIEEQELQMQKFVKKQIEGIPLSESVLLVLKRFEKLNLECLCMDRRYLDVAEMLEKEIFILKDVYNTQRRDPPIPRNSPPLGGRILWIRMLHKRIDVPMQVIKTKPCVLAHEKAQRTVKYYNYMSGIIIHYDMMHHQAWYDYVEEVRNYLHKSVLVGVEKKAIYIINLHDSVYRLIRETECFWKINLAVPDLASLVTFCKNQIMDAAVELKKVMKDYEEHRSSISVIMLNIMRFLLRDLEIEVKPGLSFIKWTSEELNEFIERFKKLVEKQKEFHKTVQDIQNTRILSVMDSIAEMMLAFIPTTPTDPEVLLDQANLHRLNQEREIEFKSQSIEKAVIEFINAFVDLIELPPDEPNAKKRQYQLPRDQINDSNWKAESFLPIDKYDWIQFDKINRTVYFPPEDGRIPLLFKEYDRIRYTLNTLRNDCMDLFSYFNAKMVNTLVTCTKKSLDNFRKKLLNPNWKTSPTNPVISTVMELNIPRCIIKPSLEEIQLCFQSIYTSAVESHYHITTWGKQAKTPERRMRRVYADENRQEKSYFKSISEHKDVLRAIQNLSSGLSMFKKDIDDLLDSTYKNHKYLWADSREAQIRKFVDSEPLTVDIRDRFMEYDELISDLQGINPFVVIGPIQIKMEKVINSFVEESKIWKLTLGKLLSKKYKVKLENMTDFIKEQQNILDRPINNLDDVRVAINCLDTIRDREIMMDKNMQEILQVYQIFYMFKIYVDQDDTDAVDVLQLSFDKMLDDAKKTSLKIVQMQAPLLKELKNGIATFAKEIADFNNDFEVKGPMVDGIGAKEAADRVFVFQSKFDELWRKFEMYASGEKLFGLAVTDYPILHQRRREFGYLTKLYGLYIQVLKTVDEYSNITWTEIDIEKINNEIQDFIVRCRKLPKGMQTWPAFIDLKKKIDDFNETVPMLELMTDKAMKERHWDRINKVLGTDFDVTSPKFVLGHVLQSPILNFKDDVEDICVGAVKELDIEAKLKQVVVDWAQVHLQTGPFKQRGDLLLKGGETADIITALEDSVMIMNSLATNRYNAPFKKDIMIWLKKLISTGEILEKWIMVQNLWMYLEAVFVGGDISKQLPQEAKRFADIDKKYVKIMFRAREVTNAIECCTADESLQQMLNFLMDQLEACQKSLTGYLEKKRLVFPRFFFVSDPVLLEILGQASDPTTIQPHLLSIFDAVAIVDFAEGSKDVIVAMNSANGEKVPLETNVQCQGGVEIWIGKLLQEMQDTMRTILGQVALSFNDPNYDFLQEFPSYCGQAALIGVQLLWTRQAEIALKKSKVDPSIMKSTNNLFLNILNFLIELTIKDLTKLERINYETMVTIHVHQRDIFDDLVRLKIRSTGDFEWQKQARFYYIENTEEIIVSITDVDFIYQNEYLGVTERLAITPLTDRCYITLAQAMGMSMGGAPAGPAGTGKTETTKDMGRALGKLVVVFNCSDQMDFRGLGRIYKGLAQSGSWGCFDEFNRIELPVLSVAAQQIYIVLTARKEKKSFFLFSDGDTVSLNPEFGLFITMNPGYAGRQELPENLKIQFRSVAMMVPDRQIIMRVKLASCGFKDNVPLSRKFYTLYKLCEEQLSKQVHYDFGLRNILSVLRTLGAQKRAAPGETEETILMRVLKDMNVSKLTDEDEPLFQSLIEDMFPGLKLTTSAYKDLQRAIASSAASLGFVNCPTWNLKVIQLYESSLVRHGLMLMGPTGAGKTTCTRTLLTTFTEMGRPHREMRMNPKAITAPQMFGRLDVATNDWTDGIFSTLWRRSWKVKPGEFVWLILDGPVDAVWIENLNSVLDDNKTLTLANGDRIKMAECCKLVFEPDNVDNASPATVSRVGMVFTSSSVVKWNIYLEAWLQKRPAEADNLRANFDSVYDDALTQVQTKIITKMKLLDSCYITQCLSILDGLLDGTSTDKFLDRIFIFCMMWSLGAVLEIPERQQLEDFLVKHPSKLKLPKKEPSETIFEYYVEKPGQWAHWLNRVELYDYPDDSVPEYAGILIPNVDNVRTGFLLHNIAKQKRGVLLIGEQGTAKTVMIKGYMLEYDPEAHMSKSFNFSSATTPNMYQKIIESYVEKRVGLSYGPPGQRKMTIFIDDINMPIINEWGDQITNEIVRQMVEQGGFYALDKPGDFYTILDIQILAAMIHPGGGRNDVPNRLKRQFCVFNCTLPSNNSMDQIFRTIGEGYFCPTRFKQEVVDCVPYLVPLTRIFWQNVKIKMLPTPANFHYVFNLRDLSRIWEGMLTIQGLECQNATTLIKLWRHECARVIADRFTDFKDKNWFWNRMDIDSKKHLGKFVNFYDETETYFVDFLREALDPGDDDEEDVSLEPPKIYEEIPSYEFVIWKVKWYMGQFNEYVRGFFLDLVFFKDALVHLMIISRIIRTPRGNALLVGVGGSGKQSLTRLSSFIAGYKFHQIVLTRSYNASNLADDLKYLYRTSGLEGQGITFIFTDNEIKEEGFLEFINNVLSSGEIAGLFPKDEMDEIFGELIPVMKKVAPKRPPTQDNLYDFFISRARFNLHIALCFSPIGDKFRARALKFPGLISGCTIDWFQKWSEDGRVAVSRHYLQDFSIVCSEEVKDNLIEIMSFVHETVGDGCSSYFEKFRRQTFVTPKTLIAFLESYKLLYRDKQQNIVILAERMSSGLYKLDEAAESVNLLKIDLIEMNKLIEVANAAAEVVLEEVATKSAAAEVIKAQVAQVKSEAEALVIVISADKAVAEAKLEKAKPALDAAEAALKTIKAADIATVRKLGKPPYLITLIMDCVIIYFGKHLDPCRPDPEKVFLMSSWAEALKVMSDTAFLRKILEYPTDTINGEMIDLLTPYFLYPQYTLEAAKVACGNVAGLLSWTVAMAQYYEVNKEVLPLKANLAVQEAKYRKAAGELQAAEDLFAAKEAELAEVQRAFDEALGKKQAVQAEAKKVTDKMDAATALIDGLKDEKVRWTEQLAQFKSETDRLVGDVILLTGFLGYSGPFNQEFRSMFLNKWNLEIITRKIPISANINIIDSLTDNTQISEWNLEGLPTDELSIQNGIIATKALRYPLLIDPQSQGKIWIKNKEKKNGLIVTTLTHKYFRNHIEDAVSMGFPIIIEDISEELDPCLDNVLDRNLLKVGTTYKIRVGDKEVDYNRDFRLYITTKLPNPAYTPEICARAAIIDFTVTMKGLEDQLLGRVIITERKELEDERTELVETVTGNLKLMKELEANLLHKLSTTEGSLLDDVTVIQVLNTSKKTANEVKEKLAIAKVTEEKINNAREEYRPVATRGSVLYFLVTSMTMVNCMYQTSLVQFLERFDASMANSVKTNVTQKRIKNIIRYLNYETYRYKSRGLYETHKYLFVLLMALNIDIQMKVLSYDEFQNFIKGGAALNLKDCPAKPHKWITDETWLNLVQLSNLRQFSNICTQITENERGWKNWFNKPKPEIETIPDGYNNVDVFKRLLLIRAWCPDRTVAQSRAYISNSLGSKFVEPVILSYDELLIESRPLTPLVCFLSMGSDPSPAIESLAKRQETTVRAISMGQGQEIHARKLMSECLESGGWVLLQNCHLGLEYMVEIVVLFMELEKENTGFHTDFRLWITTEVHEKFPITLLQFSIKYTNEPPPGLRAGLKGTYGNLTQDFLDHSESPFYHPLVFGISFLHSVVQERRKFGPLGWNIPYEFNSADWLASCMFVQNHLDDLDPKRGISWVTVRYMLGEIQYGGRVTDDYDKRLLNTFARVWFSEAMFAEEFCFYTGYKILRYKTQEEYLNAIENMPGVDAPQALGFHPNADITYQTNAIKSILDTIVSIQPKESAGAGAMTREDKVGMQTRDMLSKLPPNYDLFDVKEKIALMGAYNPLNIFLRQEIDRMQKIIVSVRATMKDLLLAIEGTIIMSDQLRNALDNIFNARVPAMWLKGSWVSSTLGFWYTELLERNGQFYSWCYNGRPVVFWMSGFFNPQGFLTAMKQEVARAHKGWALDQVVLQNEVLKQMAEEIKKPPKEGVFVEGLFLDGAGWDKRTARLIEATNKVLYVLMPVIHIYALGSVIKRSSRVYECPVYKKINRTALNFITPLWLDSLKMPDHWTLRGAALLGDIK